MIELIKNAKVGDVIWDKDDKQSVTGLHVRIVSEGRRSFYLFYRTRGGQQRRPKIGDFGEITVTQARRMAKNLLEQVAQGKDPKGEWDALKAERTLSQVYDLAMMDLWSQKRFVVSGWTRRVESLWRIHVGPTFGAKKLSELSTPQIRSWHQREGVGIYAANRALEVLSRLYTFAQEQGLFSHNPCQGVRAFTETKRERFATPQELPVIWELLEQSKKRAPRGVAFMKVLLLTGSRPRALERATPDQLRIVKDEGGDYGVLSFHGKTTSDSGQMERIVIPPLALQEILALPPSKDGTIFGCKIPRTLWGRIRTKAGCPDLWVRDSRRTFATVGMSGGVDSKVVGELLNHKSAQTTKIYARLMENTRVQVAGEIANQVVRMTT